MADDQMQKARTQLSENCADFWVHSIRRIEVPSPVEFLRDSLNSFHPVIIKKGLVEHWPARNMWDMAYIENKCQGTYPINVTPDGRADSIQLIESKPKFCYPEQVNLSMKTFKEMLEHPEMDDAVVYLSEQDNNFKKSFPELGDDIELSLPLANECFGCLPEAVNIWIGDERSVSSLHKDHFENMYVVVSGEKTFSLLPPTDAAYLPYKSVPTIQHKLVNPQQFRNGGQRIKQKDLCTSPDGCPTSQLSWIDIDIDSPNVHLQHPDIFKYIRPVHCVVKAGEVLYIPPMWYHQVSQTKLTISINFWYEQKFDFRYVCQQLALSLRVNAKNDSLGFISDKESPDRED